MISILVSARGEDLRDLVDAAHDRGLYVILDVIYNHSGNNWFYRDEQTGEARERKPIATRRHTGYWAGGRPQASVSTAP